VGLDLFDQAGATGRDRDPDLLGLHPDDTLALYYQWVGYQTREVKVVGVVCFLAFSWSLGRKQVRNRHPIRERGWGTVSNKHVATFRKQFFCQLK